MATYTTNYNLEKPAQTDIYNVDVFNDNADKIDAGLTDKAEKTMLAPVETTNSASRSYAKGEYFVYNNVLCCATTAIAAGGTIAIGTNCSTAPVGGELKSLRESLPYFTSFEKMSFSVPMDATITAFTAPQDGYYSLTAINHATTGVCFAYILSDTNSSIYILASHIVTGNYIRTSTGFVALKAGATVYLRANATGEAYVVRGVK